MWVIACDSLQSLPEYYEVIKEPMDLRGIARKVQSNAYTGLDEMLRDLNLMCANAKLFNEPGSEIYKVCHVKRSFNLCIVGL